MGSDRVSLDLEDAKQALEELKRQVKEMPVEGSFPRRRMR